MIPTNSLNLKLIRFEKKTYQFKLVKAVEITLPVGCCSLVIHFMALNSLMIDFFIVVLNVSDVLEVFS